MPLHPPAPTLTAGRPPAPESAPARGLTLEDRLALADATMTARLAAAAVAYEVNTAHIPTGPLDLTDVVRLPLAPSPRPPGEAHTTPVAALLQRAHHRLATGGWCSGRLVDEDGARCLLGALRAEAHGDAGLEGSAADLLLDTIRRTFAADVPSVPRFNDAFATPSVPLRTLAQATTRAATQGL
ncbi:hypothetical protein ACIQUQ_15935 [Streptomyces sp. NPDC101118]|uniref:DUF6197 family protein n=1 Tax=Streptomyces sp. NPDC101118 TaxID=3366109 RepID=UPI003825FE48